MDVKFNTVDGETVARELLVALLNVGDSGNPDWQPLGSRTTDSSAEYDWSSESNTDILGKTRTTKKKPVITEAFDPLPLDGGDKAISYLHNLAIVEQNAAALCNLEMMIVHMYTTVDESKGYFAEHYDACSVDVSSLGGEGGGNVGMPISVTFGGTRTKGAVTSTGGKYEFTDEATLDAE